MPRNLTNWSESSLLEQWETNGITQIEGIYESFSSLSQKEKLKLGLVKANEGYILIYLSGAYYFLDWDEGEIKARLTPTATSSFYKAE